MTSHPNRSRGPYTVEIGGSSWGCGPQSTCATIREARAWAESYGSTADWCEITNRHGVVVGKHYRDPSTDKWFRAE